MVVHKVIEVKCHVSMGSSIIDLAQWSFLHTTYRRTESPTHWSGLRTLVTKTGAKYVCTHFPNSTYVLLTTNISTITYFFDATIPLVLFTFISQVFFYQNWKILWIRWLKTILAKELKRTGSIFQVAQKLNKSALIFRHRKPVLSVPLCNTNFATNLTDLFCQF